MIRYGIDLHVLLYASLRIEHQRPQLYTLPMRRTLRTRRVKECRMGSQPRPVRLRVKALDQRHLFRGLLRQVPPLVRRVVAYAKRRPDAVRVNVLHRDEVVALVE